MIQLVGTTQRPLYPILVYSQDEKDNRPHNFFIFQASSDGQGVNVYDMGDRVMENKANAEPLRFVCRFETRQLKLVVSAMVLDENEKFSEMSGW